MNFTENKANVSMTFIVVKIANVIRVVAIQ